MAHAMSHDLPKYAPGYTPELPDDGPLARLEAVKVDAGVPEEVFARVAGGDSLKVIARAWGVPVGRFSEWFMECHGGLYDAALKVHAADLALQALEFADPRLGKDEVPAAKLAADVRLRLASFFDRDRYGAAVKVTKDVNVVVSAGLVRFAGDLLDHVGKRGGLSDKVAGRTLTYTRSDGEPGEGEV